ncbi:MAG: DegQ family serine endoprotease [Vicinamibacteria bacterium]
MTTNFDPSGGPKRSRLRPAALAAIIASIFIAAVVAVGPTTSGWQARQGRTSLLPSTPEPTAVEPSIPSTETPKSEDRNGDLPTVEALSRAFATVAEELEPAVVNVFTEQSGEAFHPPTGGPFDEFFERFFRDQPDQRRRSLGSGVIIDARGYVVTNNHVVENAEEIEIQFSDERRFRAEVVGTDPPTDLAVLRIKSDGSESFPHVPFGDSDRVVVGEWVLAMGNPFGFGHTVTSGIVSAKGRVIGQGTYDDFIQTDAAINPGNSGGPLVNMKAEVIGINSNIISNSGGSMGIGFAIPSNMTRKVYEQLVSEGTVTRGWLGVQIQPLTPELARNFGLAGRKGALVSDILGEDSPAAKAGLKAGDVIVELNGIPVDSNTHLVHLVADIRPEETIALKYFRDGKEASTRVTVAKRTVDEALSPAAPDLEGEKGRLGISGQNLTQQLATEIGASSATGVLLVGVDPDGPAEDAGLRRGDIIIEANREPVRSVDDLQRIIAEVPRAGDLLLRVERVVGGRSSYAWVPVTLD